MVEMPETKYWKKIELFLNKKKGVNVREIAKHLEVHWATAEKELQKLENMGRVHSEKIGNMKVYFLNGVGKFQEKFSLGSNHTLFIDTFISPFGERFVRIKESKKVGDEWKQMGNVIITKEVLKEVGNFLNKVETNIS